MNANLEAIFSSIKHQSQRQDGTNDQFSDLAHFAKRLGLDGAASFVYKPVNVDRSRPLPSYLQEILNKIPQQPEIEGNGQLELLMLRSFATRLGLYDAADLVRTVLERN